MSYPLNCSTRSTLYYWGTSFWRINPIVKMVSSPTILCNALEARMVGIELRHECGSIGMQFMYEEKWASRSWLLTRSYNIVIPAREDVTIEKCSWLFLAVEEMDGSCLDKTLNRLAFMKDKIRRNVKVEQPIIYFSWLQSVN